MELAADENDDSIALLTNPDESRGVSIGHNVSTLPCFSLWKNTVGFASCGACSRCQPNDAIEYRFVNRFEIGFIRQTKSRIAKPRKSRNIWLTYQTMVRLSTQPKFVH